MQPLIENGIPTTGLPWAESEILPVIDSIIELLKRTPEHEHHILLTC